MRFDILFPTLLFAITAVGMFLSKKAEPRLKTVVEEREFRNRDIALLVAMIAVARKVIVLDIKELDGLKLIAVALILTGLSVGYYFVKRTHTEKKPQ